MGDSSGHYESSRGVMRAWGGMLDQRANEIHYVRLVGSLRAITRRGESVAIESSRGMMGV